MTHQVGSGVKFIQGIWEYVFAPIPIVDHFPYLQLRDLSSDYLGYFIIVCRETQDGREREALTTKWTHLAVIFPLYQPVPVWYTVAQS